MIENQRGKNKMKNQKVIAVALGLTLSFGALASVGTLSSYADGAAQKQVGAVVCEKEQDNFCDDPLFIAEEYSLDLLLKELEQNKVLNKVELEQYKKAELEIHKLYENIDFDKISDKEFDKLFEQENKIYEQNKAIYDKVDMYFTSLDDMLLPNDDYFAFDDLTEEEIAKIEKVDVEVDKLYDKITDETTDAELEKIFDEIDKLYGGIAYIFDKIDNQDIMLY